MGQKLIIKDANDLDIWRRTGTVVGHQQSVHSSTTVTTSGGGGYLHQGTGYVHAPTTTASTTSEEKLRVFFREDDGEETEAEFWDAPFGVREGHRVSVIYAGPKALNTGRAVALINHSTGKDNLFLARLDSMLPKMSGCLALALVLGTPVVLLVLGVVLFESPAGLVLGFIGGLAVVISRLAKRKALANAVADKIRVKIKEVIEQERAKGHAA